jgi:hypothetical protein
MTQQWIAMSIVQLTKTRFNSFVVQIILRVLGERLDKDPVGILCNDVFPGLRTEDRAPHQLSDAGRYGPGRTIGIQADTLRRAMGQFDCHAHGMRLSASAAGIQEIVSFNGHAVLLPLFLSELIQPSFSIH